MSKKRAFVRYTKSGEIVPGSLIITTNGGYPDKSSIWKEIQTNECCDGGGGTTRLASQGFDKESNFFTIICDGVNLFRSTGYTGTTTEQWLEYFNSVYGYMGTFSVNPENPNQIFFDIKTEILNSICTSGTIEFIVGNA